ncbi:hypothetical protein ABK249_20615 [Neorhizobium sp. Rsf11]|uniref:Uncharacterized protein n=1 Tax=Neorhizobium phenanthreniclasticum TaxID=3157917 RepID=A0ABV0M626_9HYPH
MSGLPRISRGSLPRQLKDTIKIIPGDRTGIGKDISRKIGAEEASTVMACLVADPQDETVAASV